MNDDVFNRIYEQNDCSVQLSKTLHRKSILNSKMNIFDISLIVKIFFSFCAFSIVFHTII